MSQDFTQARDGLIDLLQSEGKAVRAAACSAIVDAAFKHAAHSKKTEMDRLALTYGERRDQVRASFIAMRKKHEHAEPVEVAIDAPISLNGKLYRITYIPQQDLLGLITDEQWRDELDLARKRAAAT